MVVGGAALIYLAVLWVLGYGPIGNRPLLLYGILLVMMGVQLFSLGVLAELMIKLSHRSEAPSVREMVGFRESPSGKRRD